MYLCIKEWNKWTAELIFYLLRTFCLHLGSFYIVSSSLRFGQISPLAFFRWLTATSYGNAESCGLSHHVFDQVNLWPAWVGIETAIFWHCPPGTEETQHPYPPRHGPRRAIKVGFFGLINPIICSPYLVFHSRVRTEFVIFFFVF